MPAPYSWSRRRTFRLRNQNRLSPESEQTNTWLQIHNAQLYRMLYHFVLASLWLLSISYKGKNIGYNPRLRFSLYNFELLNAESVKWGTIILFCKGYMSIIHSIYTCCIFFKSKLSIFFNRAVFLDSQSRKISKWKHCYTR